MSKKNKRGRPTEEPLSFPRAIRFPADVEEELQEIARTGDMNLGQAVRKAARAGLPFVKKEIAEAIKRSEELRRMAA